MIKTTDIINKVFSRSFMGYDMREVDTFFDDIIEQFEAYETEKKELLAAMEQLLSELEAIERTGVIPAVRKRAPLLEQGAGEKARGSVRIAQPQGGRGAGQKRREAVSLEIETGSAAPPKRILQQELKQAAAADKAETAYEEESDVL